MKTLLMALICACAFGTVSTPSLAKDGPFPIANAVGTWVAETGRPLSVRIMLGQAVDNGQAVEVYVLIRDGQGHIVAQGKVVHYMMDSFLTIYVQTETHQRLVVVMKAVPYGANGEKPEQGTYHILMSVQEAEQSGVHPSQILLGRHITR